MPARRHDQQPQPPLPPSNGLPAALFGAVAGLLLPPPLLAPPLFCGVRAAAEAPLLARTHSRASSSDSRPY